MIEDEIRGGGRGEGVRIKPRNKNNQMNGKQRPRGKKRGSVGSAKPHGEKSERGVNYTTIRGFGHS